MKSEKSGIFSRLFLLFIALILIGAISACGRKGDPVPIIPADQSASSAALRDNIESEDSK